MNRLLLIAITLFTGGLVSAQPSILPAETDFQSDLCAECKMVVTSRSYAAQIVGPGGPLFFDDIGCLVQYERQGKVAADNVHGRFVRSVAGDAWLPVQEAFWVLTRDVRTPMGYGLHAFADQKTADAFRKGKTGAKLLAWNEVPLAVPARNGMSMDGMGKM